MLKLNLQNYHFMTVHFWHYISIKDGKRSFPIINKVMTFTKCVHSLTVPASEGRWEGKGRKERNHFIIYHQAFLKQNMQHFPFIRTNCALCVGTVQLSPAWMEVSILLIVTVLLLEAYRLPINIILLTVRGVVSVWHVKFFQNRLFSSSSRQSEWMGHLCRTGGHLHLCVFRTNVYDWDWQSLHVLINWCVLKESCVFVILWMTWDRKLKPQTTRLSYRMTHKPFYLSDSVYLIIQSNTQLHWFTAIVNVSVL